MRDDCEGRGSHWRAGEGVGRRDVVKMRRRDREVVAGADAMAGTLGSKKYLRESCKSCPESIEQREVTKRESTFSSSPPKR